MRTSTRASTAAAVLAAAIAAGSCSPGASSSSSASSAPASGASSGFNIVASDLPPLPSSLSYAVRPVPVVKSAYAFAARHPEVLRYVPCFCGCERGGHQANHDCYVKRRDSQGHVVEWDEHGIGCEVCVDVAQMAMQMHDAGASVAQIRAAVEQRFGGRHMGHTPTPQPPAGG
ncbi:MAG TPA: PCYCGC motif-containing (lipo)protein [Vicinamibacterales bacterium]|nr:PCYCGC motif-containing (lipo)protein [Vicinamibacterales bacterium]